MSEVESVPDGKMQSPPPFSEENATSGMNFIVIYVILSKSLSILCFSIGCWFGDPDGRPFSAPVYPFKVLDQFDASCGSYSL